MLLQVYIVKIDNLNEVDGALGLLGLDTSAKRFNPGKIFIFYI